MVAACKLVEERFLRAQVGYVVDCESLEAHRGRRGGLVTAARYLTKFLTKPEELMKLMGGPGCLAHLVGATHGLRRFAVGGGYAVLRKAASILLLRQTHQAEEALAGTWLHQGRATWRVEAVDPDTGERVDVPPERLGDGRQRALEISFGPSPTPWRRALPIPSSR